MQKRQADDNGRNGMGASADPIHNKIGRSDPVGWLHVEDVGSDIFFFFLRIRYIENLPIGENLR